MKKRLLSLFLSVVMVLALLPVKTYAADGHTHNYEKGICECGAHNGEHTEWTEWTQTDALPDEKGYFYLAADVALTSTWQVPTGTTYLCLNGHLISPASGADPISLVSVPDGATLNLYDCSTEKHFYKVGSDGLWTLDTEATAGTPFDSLTARPDVGTVVEVPGGCITGGEKSEDNFAAGAVTVATGGAFNMHGGNIIGNSNTNRGGAVFVSGSFTLTSGNILGNLATGNGDYTGGGAGVCVSGGTFTMTGGNISFNNVPNYAAGGIMVLDLSGGSFNMSDGNIKYNYANGNGGGVCTNRPFTMTGGCIEGNVSSAGGGGVRVTAKGSMTATGGQIINNSSTSDGGGVNMAGTVTLGGTIKINGNKKGTGSSAVTQNIFLPSGKTVTVATGDAAPAEGMSVGVTLAGESGVFTDTVTDVTYFVSDNARYCVMEKNSKLYITNSWAELNSALSATGDPETVEGLFKVENGIIKLLSDISAGADDNNLVVDGTKSLDLNGHVLKGNGDKRVLYINEDATLNLYDTDTATKHYFKVGSDGLWTLDTEATDGTALESLTCCPTADTVIEVIGGCITGGGVVDLYGGGVYVYGSLNMYGGNIVGNKAGRQTSGSGTDTIGDGGGVYVNKDGSFEMQGGSICGNAVTGITNNDNGGGIYNVGTLTLKGTAMIIGNKSGQQGGGIYHYAGTFIMDGDAKIVGNATNARSGGGIYLYSGTITIKDGEVSGNSAHNNGGAIYANSGTLTVSGGKLTRNIAGTGKGTGLGGGVYADGNCSFTMIGGEISDNKATHEGGLYPAGNITIGGTAKITGNYGGCTDSAGVLSGGKLQNLYIPADKTVTIATGDNVPAVGMSVGITTGNTNGIGKFTGTADAAYIQYFTPDNTALVTAHVTDHLELTTGWKALKNALNGTITATVPGVFEIDEDGVIKLVTDVKAASDDSQLVVSGTRTVDLNGHAIDRNLSTAKSGGNVIYINSGAVLTVRDSSGTDTSNGTGKITGGNNSTTTYTSPGCAGGVHNYGGTFYFEGGSICGNKTGKTGGGVYNLAGGTVVMSGYATISDNTASSWSGGFENNNYNSGSKSSSLTMKDHSRIVNNKAKLGGGADFCDSTRLVMQDYSSISGNTATDTGGGIYLYDGTTSIIMSGHATVSDNTATNAGSGIFCGKNTVKVIVGGSASVSGNKLSSETENNVSLKAGGVITISTGDDAPTDDMSVGITTATAPTATAPVAFTGENSTDYHNNFFPDAGRLLQDVSYVSKKLYLSIPKISVSQTGTNPVYGTAMPSNDFYSVSTNGFGDAPDLKLEWKSGTGTSTVWGDDAPAGITAGLTNGKISIATDATLNAGTYTFRVTNGENEFTTGTTKNPMFVTSAETVFTVGKASLTVTAKDKSIIYGEAPANDGVEYSGFVNSETADVLGGMLVYDYSANGTAYVSGGSVGTYDIIPSGLSSDNYEITFEKGSLKVDRRQLTVTGTEVEAQRIYDGTVVINVSSIGYLGNIANSDSVTLSATAACADAGAGKDKQVTVTYTISGTKADNYIAPAADSSFTTEIIKATPTVSAPTALSIGVHSITLNEQSGPCGTEYGYNTVNETPSTWQESTEFTGLDKLTAYYFFTKFKGNENYNEAVSTGRSITTADPNHQHVWSYSASGNMITAECGNSDSQTARDIIHLLRERLTRTER